MQPISNDHALTNPIPPPTHGPRALTRRRDLGLAVGSATGTLAAACGEPDIAKIQPLALSHPAPATREPVRHFPEVSGRFPTRVQSFPLLVCSQVQTCAGEHQPRKTETDD